MERPLHCNLGEVAEIRILDVKEPLQDGAALHCNLGEVVEIGIVDVKEDL